MPQTTGEGQLPEVAGIAVPTEAVNIAGFPGYSVTPDGRVFSTQKWRGTNYRELKQDIHKQGYRIVTLCDPNGARKRFLIHRLVAQAFLPAPENPYWEIRHLDDNPSNNDMSNLAWGSHVMNAADADRNGRIFKGSQHTNAFLTEDQVMKIRELLKDRRYPGQHGDADGKLSYEEIAEMYGVSKACVANIATRSWQHVR